MNVVYLMGNLGQDVAIRQTNGGQKVGEASLATTKSAKVNGEWQQKTTWHKVVGFGKIAERLAQLRKGEMVFVVGEIVVEQWTSQEGQARTATKVYAQKVVRAYELKLDSQPSSGGHDDPSYSTPPF